jgi:hypothetical protein
MEAKPDNASDSLKAHWEIDMKGPKMPESGLTFFRENNRASLEAIRDLAHKVYRHKIRDKDWGSIHE